MHSTSLIPVEGHDGYCRDPLTKAIINTNNLDYETYVSAREKNNSLTKSIENNSESIKELKSEINEIKNLLLQIIPK